MIAGGSWAQSMQLLGENINGENKLFVGQKGRNRAPARWLIAESCVAVPVMPLETTNDKQRKWKTKYVCKYSSKQLLDSNRKVSLDLLLHAWGLLWLLLLCYQCTGFCKDAGDNYVLFFAPRCLMNNSHLLLFSAFQTNDSAGEMSILKFD